MLDGDLLNAILISEELRDAVQTAKGIKQHEARRRQLQYIGRLMRDAGDDACAIKQAIERAEGRNADEKRKFKQVEIWRNELVAGSQSRYEWLVENYSQVDQQHLQRLIRKATGEPIRSNTKHAYRNLFRYLRQLID